MRRFSLVCLTALALAPVSAFAAEVNTEPSAKMAAFSKVSDVSNLAKCSLLKERRAASPVDEGETVWSDWQELGTAAVEYAGVFYVGRNPELPISVREDVADANHRQYKVDNYFFSNVDENDQRPLLIDVEGDKVSVDWLALPALNIVDENGNMLTDGEGNPIQFYASDYATLYQDESLRVLNRMYESPLSFEIMMAYHDDTYIYGYGTETVTLNVEPSFALPAHTTVGGDMGMGFLHPEMSDPLALIYYAIVKGAETDADGNSLVDRVMANDPSLMIMTQMSGDIMLTFSEGPGRYTLAAVARDLDDNLLGTAMTRVYYMPSDSWDWESMGTRTLTEGFLPDVYGFEPLTYEVEVEKSLSTPGLYRIVDMYGVNTPFEDIVVERTVDHPVYTYLHCEDPDACYISETSTGVVLDASGEIIISSYPEFYSQMGYPVEVTKEMMPEMFGTLSNGTLRFGAGTLLATAPVIDYNWLEVNAGGVFSLKFDDATEISAIASDNASDAEYYNLQGVRVERPSAGDIVIERRGEKVRKVIVR